MNGAGAALLLAAGKATRLAGLRERWAKACVPVADSSPLAFLLPRVLAGGWSPIWINLHHHAEQVRASARGLAPAAGLRFLDEPELLGTGGTLLAVARAQTELPTLCANAKVFGDFELGALRAAAPGTLLLHAGSPLAEFGGIEHDRAGRILGLAPRDADPSRAAVFTGLCVPHPAWLPPLARARAARPGQPICLLRDGLLPALAAGVEHRALFHPGWWCEVSTPERLAQAAARLSRAAPPDRAAADSAPCAR